MVDSSSNRYFKDGRNQSIGAGHVSGHDASFSGADQSMSVFSATHDARMSNQLVDRPII